MNSVATADDLRMATVMAAVAVVLLTGVVLGRLVQCFRQPAVIGEIAAGIILGPSLLPGNLTERLFPADTRPALHAISQIGLLLFMFLIGWTFERELLSAARGAAVTISLTCVAFAFALGAGLALIIYSRHSTVDGDQVDRTAFALFLGAAMAVTAFPVLARIIGDNRLGHTRVAALALAGAAVDDVLAWCLLAWVSALVSVEGRSGDLIQIAVLSLVYVAFMVAVARPVLARFVGHMSDRGYWRALFVVLCAGALLSAYATTWIGIHAIFGAFAFGFVTPREPARALAEHVATPLNHIATILLPVFFIVTGLSVDIGSLGGTDYLELAAILVVATAGKMIGATVPARLLGLPWREARILGLLMNTRGLTELIILNAALSLGVLDGKLFTMMVIMALFTTALAGPLLPRDPGSLPGAAELIPHRTSSGAWGKLGAALTPPSGGQR